MAAKRPIFTTLPVDKARLSADPAPNTPGHPVYASVPLFSDRFPSSIRLLMILPHNDSNSQIRAHMYSTDLGTRYSALSYAWTHDTSATILLNGQPFKISSDLYQCMQAISKNGAVVWIDAICINQADDVERAAQVAIMAQIYRNCQECIVWLGSEKDDSQLIFALLEEFREMSLVAEATGKELTREQVNRMCSLDTYGEALMHFCTRPYWSRLWIVQENMLAPCVFLVVGDHNAMGDSFRNILRNMAVLNDHGFYVLTQKLGHNMQQLFEFSAAHRAGSVLDFLQGLLVSRSCHFNDGRDVVYAILGLVDPAQTQEMEIKVDYSMSTNRLWGAVTSRVMKQSRSLNILAICYPVRDPKYKEAAFQARTNLIEHFLDNSMNDFDTALAVWRRNVRGTEMESMVAQLLHRKPLEKAKEATEHLQSRRHLVSDLEFKRALAQAWLPPSKCESYRLPTWVPNWSDTRKINYILYGVENGRITKRNFRASKDTEPDTYTLAHMDPDTRSPDSTAIGNSSFTTLRFKCHKVDTIAQLFEAHTWDDYQAVLEFWLVMSNLHPLLASMSLAERVRAFTDMLLLKPTQDPPRMSGYHQTVDFWVKSSRDACAALINERVDACCDKTVGSPDSSAGSAGMSVNFISLERPVFSLKPSERPAAVIAALALLASDAAEPSTPEPDTDRTPDIVRREVEIARETLTQLSDLAGYFKIFITRGGFVGLAGHYMEQGDVVCIPLGCDVPLIIRPASDTSESAQLKGQVHAKGQGDQGQGSRHDGSLHSQGISALLGPEYQVVDRSNTTTENYWLISESYVAGIMNGEFLDQLNDGAEPEMVTIY